MPKRTIGFYLWGGAFGVLAGLRFGPSPEVCLAAAVVYVLARAGWEIARGTNAD